MNSCGGVIGGRAAATSAGRAACASTGLVMTASVTTVTAASPAITGNMLWMEY
jgi:hypothetical protein